MLLLRNHPKTLKRADHSAARLGATAVGRSVDPAPHPHLGTEAVLKNNLALVQRISNP